MNASFRTSITCRRSCRGCVLGLLKLQNADGTVCVHEGLSGYTANIGLGNLVDLVELLEELAPVAAALLVDGKLGGEVFVIAEAAEQVSAASGPEHLQPFISHVGGFQFVDFLVDRVFHLI